MIVSSVRSRSIGAYDRLDAHYFTSSGVAASERLAVLEAAGASTVRLGDGGIAEVWDPPRFARAYAAPLEPGMPYLRPYDVFDYIPHGSDRLSRLRNEDLDRLTPAEGTISQTCSGRNLGPCTVADQTLSEFCLSHDMVRIDVADPDLRMYVLAYLKTPTGQALLRRGKSGSVVDHITAADIAAVPLPLADDDTRRAVTERMRRGVAGASAARSDLRGLVARREAELPTAVRVRPTREGWTLHSGRIDERLDAGFYEPGVAAARAQLQEAGGLTIGDLARAYLPVRYKRYYVDAAHGRPILSGRQLLQLEPVNLRHVSDRSFRNPELYELSAGTTVFGAVGRSEGRQGTPSLVTQERDGWLASNDVMRLSPRAGTRPGAVWLALTARQTRLQINALSFGSVVDHMNPWDVERVLVPPVEDEDAAAAEAAWARFGTAATNIGGAVALLESQLGG